MGISLMNSTSSLLLLSLLNSSMCCESGGLVVNAAIVGSDWIGCRSDSGSSSTWPLLSVATERMRSSGG